MDRDTSLNFHTLANVLYTYAYLHLHTPHQLDMNNHLDKDTYIHFHTLGKLSYVYTYKRVSKMNNYRHAVAHKVSFQKSA